MANLATKNNSTGTQATLGLGTLEQIKLNADGSVEIPNLPAKLDTANAFGVGQTWQQPSRALGVTYTNNTPRPIAFAVTVGGGPGTCPVIIDGITRLTIYAAPGNSLGSICLIVPPGSTYGTSPQAGVTIVSWAELR